MTRRLELGPLVVALGALLLVVSLFLNWYHGKITAWDAFEVWDIVLAALGVFTFVLAVGLVVPDLALLEPPALLFNAGAVTAIVASQIINQPPAAAGQGREIGCWIALGAAGLIVFGTLLTLSRLSFAIAIEGRDTRRRVSAVDARDPTTTTAETSSLFRRGADEREPEPEPAADEPRSGPS